MSNKILSFLDTDHLKAGPLSLSEKGQISSSVGDNVKVGTEVMESAITGTLNACLGHHVMRGSLHGVNNTACGAYALSVGSNNQSCVSIGFASQGYSNGCFGNVSVGTSSHSYATNSYFNTSIGQFSAPYTTTGSFNVNLGQFSGHAIITGNNNVSIGTGVSAPEGDDHLNIGDMIHGKTGIGVELRVNDDGSLSITGATITTTDPSVPGQLWQDGAGGPLRISQ